MAPVREQLSEHDQQVLDTIFNPFQIGGGAENFLNYSEDIPENIQGEWNNCNQSFVIIQSSSFPYSDPIEELTLSVQESIKYELDAIKLAEERNYTRSIELFSKAIDAAPERPAPWNNRAQSYRFNGEDEGL